MNEKVWGDFGQTNLGANAADDGARVSYVSSETKKICHAIPGLSVYRLLPLMIISIFCSELIIMFILAEIPELPMVTEAFVDATMLLVILSPTFYFFHYRPLRTHHHDRKIIVDQLIQSEERLNLALDAVNDGLWDWDFKTDRVYFSPRWLSMLGYEIGDIEPHFKSWDNLIHNDDKKKVFQDLDNHLSGAKNFYECEFRMKTKYSDWRWILARGKVVSRGIDGGPLRIIGTHTDIHARKKAEQTLLQNEKEIRHLSRQLISNSELEKKRLAQDLHDEFGQLLTAFQLGVEMIQTNLISESDELELHCARLMGTIDYMEKDLRRICDNLRPVMLDDIGLTATLHWLVKNINDKSKDVEVDITANGEEKRLYPEAELTCYRVCQEAINNALKHARASNVNIEMISGERTFTIRIVDNGCGFDKNMDFSAANDHWGAGLIGMHERAAAANGHININSIVNKGTTVEFVVPLQENLEGEACPVSVLP